MLPLFTRYGSPQVGYPTLFFIGVKHHVRLEELAELQLAEASRLRAEASNTAKRAFLRWIGHELRVPSQAGLLALEELQAGFTSQELVVAGASSSGAGAAAGAPDEALSAGAAWGSSPREDASATLARYMDAADTAVKSAEAIGKLLDDFLSLAKIEDGRLELEPVEFGPRQWLMDTAALFVNVLKKRRLRMRIVCSRAVPAVIRGDDNRMRQVSTDCGVAFELWIACFSSCGCTLYCHQVACVTVPAVSSHSYPAPALSSYDPGS